ncbi:MAG TPA: pilus assembly protein N-terminal domain-containing protein [Terriglobales bacterium]|jgi:pilus assembly protein CpaC|nr:pilus assembly protein N-terminal domain-containing protein [Terriglobales bacterium]
MIRSYLGRAAFFLFVIGTLAVSAQENAQPVASAPAAAVASQAATAPAEGETVHVLVGKSIVLNVQEPLTRVLSSNPDAVETMATSPTQVVVEGKKAGSSSLILWDRTGRSQVLDVVADIDIAGLRNAIQRTYPNEKLDIQADGGRVLLTGSASNPRIIEDLTKMAGVYSKDVVTSILIPTAHDRQVLLEVKFVEVDRSALTQFGVNILSTGAANTIGTTTTGQFGGFGQQKITDTKGVRADPQPDVPTPTTGAQHVPFTSEQTLNQVLNLFLFRPDIHLGAIIQALQTRNVLQILAEPNLMAISGQKASFLAGGEFPFPIVQPSQGFNSVTIQFKPFGVKLDFSGIVQDDNTLRLHVSPEVSTLDFTNALTLSGFVVPAISTRRAETEIELKDGQSFGIAGLLDRRATTQLSKVPGIGDVPVLGQLFRSRSINKSNTELLVLVTPRIIDPVRNPTAAPSQPSIAVPFLENGKFDETAPGHKEIGKAQGNEAK